MLKKRIFKRAQDFETLNYIYVVDKEKKLVGIFSLKEMLQKSEEARIEEIMVKEIIKAHPYADQEKAAFFGFKIQFKSHSGSR